MRSRYDKGPLRLVDSLIKAVRRLPTALRKSLTWDRGMELANHVQFTIATAVQVYFCDPYSPWHRDRNENTNGLLRQYYPKGMDLSDVTQAQLDADANKVNRAMLRTNISFVKKAVGAARQFLS
jgi:IS30 family transposase